MTCCSRLFLELLRRIIPVRVWHDVRMTVVRRPWQVVIIVICHTILCSDKSSHKCLVFDAIFLDLAQDGCARISLLLKLLSQTASSPALTALPIADHKVCALVKVVDESSVCLGDISDALMVPFRLFPTCCSFSLFRIFEHRSRCRLFLNSKKYF